MPNSSRKAQRRQQQAINTIFNRIKRDRKHSENLDSIVDLRRW